ncbi:hypothetical protein [Glycomyces sp. NPDC021274]|uniref:hypothetical protein n=1 Tax=Glycomyces sp. NPDC021274 TaxID=3155120 RepID=UPI0033ED115F
MGLQEYFRLLIGSACLGIALFALPFTAAFLTDFVSRRLAARSHRVWTVGVSLLGSAIAAAIIHPLATWPSLAEPVRWYWPVLIGLAGTYWVSLVLLSLGSLKWNFEGPRKDKRYFTGLADLGMELDQRELRERRHELGRFGFVGPMAVLTGTTLEAGFLYLVIVSSHRADEQVQTFGFGMALGAVVAMWGVRQFSRKRYTQGRLLQEVVLVLLPPAAESISNMRIRRSRLPGLLRGEAMRRARARRRNGGDGESADMYVLLATSRFLRRYARSHRNIAAELPEETRAVLRDLVVVLANPSRTVVMLELGGKVDAFDDDGDPDSELRRMAEAGIQERVQRIQPTVRGLIPIVGLALLIAAAAFALLGITSVEWPLI